MKFKRNSASISFFIIAGLILAFFGFFKTSNAKAEIINNFNANIVIQKDGSILVAENIIYDFGLNQKHGIFRDIPLKAKNGPHLNINVLQVKNEFGENYKFTVSIANNVLNIKIGDSNTFISGVKTYVIIYKINNSIRTFNDHDELYWNVTGNDWPIAIQKVSASITLPEFKIPNMKMDCFTGPNGSIQKDCSFHVNSATETMNNSVNYFTSRPLDANNGLTIVLSIPPGYIHNTYVLPPQSYSTSNASISKNNNFIFLFLPIFFITFILVIIKSFARRAKTIKPKPVIPNELKGQLVVVEYNPPYNLPPIEIGALLDRRVDITDISSVIMDLAVRGYIKIRYTVQEIRFWPDKKDFELIKLKDGVDLIHPADKIIFKLLFSGRDKVKLSDLKEQKTTFQSDIKKIQEDTEQHLHNEGYFDQAAKDKSKKLSIYLIVSFVILNFGFFILHFIRIFSSVININNFEFIFFTLFFGTFIVLSAITVRLAHKLTPQGISALAKILGFREFLQLTEKDKLEILNAPELQPEMFEKFLPYAMVLGVCDKWAKKFEGIYNTTPNWYEDPTATSFNSFTLAQNLNLFNSSFNQVFNITSPQSSSGFHGGGSSGGGSGGGGGGSW